LVLRVAVGVTGSSGAVFALKFLQECNAEKFLVVSKWGKVVLKDELDLSEENLQLLVKKQFPDDDLTSPLASGSNGIDGYVIIPCSTSTLGKIASGIGDTLITRMAQVALKERRKLVLCIRETPLSTVVLEHCATLSRAGAIIMPISPALYFIPKSVDEYINNFIDRLLGVIGVHEPKGWRSEELD
jgi:polyprenyl P-hydroxybenzoate/phenylacrylic acid decarboxylase-like protein